MQKNKTKYLFQEQKYLHGWPDEMTLASSAASTSKPESWTEEMRQSNNLASSDPTAQYLTSNPITLLCLSTFEKFENKF